jgi:hypothetical protein
MICQHSPLHDLLTHPFDPDASRCARAGSDANENANTTRRTSDRVDRYRASIADQIESHIARPIELPNDGQGKSSTTRFTTSPQAWYDDKRDNEEDENVHGWR